MKLSGLDPKKTVKNLVTLLSDRDSLLVSGVWGLLILLAAVIIINGYLFYGMVLFKKEEKVKTENFSMLAPKDIDNIMELLKDRQKKFAEQLNRP